MYYVRRYVHLSVSFSACPSNVLAGVLCLLNNTDKVNVTIESQMLEPNILSLGII